MLAPYCPVHRSRVLLSYSDLEGIRNLPEGIEVRFRCICGHRGTWLTGRSKRAAGSRPAERSRGVDRADG